ncbi:MAG: acyl-ACP--UDP-N-acetylglucosamine O-acyltransferase [Pseudomonadota bacterium]|nr:acyl-ACP--UDP-N-acetylglucosamine O-acyltransferase [Pseudomonadota bacterium]
MNIDARAIVDPGARLGERVSIGPWTIVGPAVEIGDDCVIDAHVILRGPTQIGARTRIYPFASVGEGTPALAYDGEPTTLVIGSDNTIREGVTLHRGTVQDRGETRIGDHNLLMPYVHVGHDSVIGDHCIFANNASVSGHCVVGDYVGMGGYAGVPQYRSIGAHAFVGGMSLVLKDVPAFVSVAGHPARAVGINVEGLKRRKFDAKTIALLRRAWATVFRSGQRLESALSLLEREDDPSGQLAVFLASLRDAPNGLVRPRGKGEEEGA